jgi:hypothetical protein
LIINTPYRERSQQKCKNEQKSIFRDRYRDRSYKNNRYRYRDLGCDRSHIFVILKMLSNTI